MSVCKFCQVDEATTTIRNPAIGHPLAVCQECRDLWDEQEYNDYQAWRMDPDNPDHETGVEAVMVEDFR